MKRSFGLLRSEFRGPRTSRGVAAVEFVIAVPVLIFVMLAAAEFGRAFVQYDTLSYSVRNGARWVSTHALDGTTGNVLIDKETIDTASKLVRFGYPGGKTAVLPEYEDTGPITVNVLDAGDGNIEVIGTYRYHPMIGGSFLPLYGGDSLNLLLLTFQVSVTMAAIS